MKKETKPKTEVLTPTKEDVSNVRDQQINYLEKELKNESRAKTMIDYMTGYDYIYDEKTYGTVCYRVINWEDCSTYDFIRYDGKSFKFIYFENDPYYDIDYSIIHIKKKYINKFIDSLYKSYTGENKSLITIMKDVFSREIGSYYSQRRIADWLDSKGIEYYVYHLYYLEKGIDL